MAVADEVYAKKLNTYSRPEDLAAFIRSHMFKPEYLEYTPK
jgi:hypothetical protein